MKYRFMKHVSLILIFCTGLLSFAKGSGDPEDQLPPSHYRQAITEPQKIKEQPSLQIGLIQELIQERYTLTPAQVKACISLDHLFQMANQETITETLNYKIFFLTWGRALTWETTTKSIWRQPFYGRLQNMSKLSLSNSTEPTELTAEVCFLLGLYQENDGPIYNGDPAKAKPYFERSYTLNQNP